MGPLDTEDNCPDQHLIGYQADAMPHDLGRYVVFRAPVNQVGKRELPQITQPLEDLRIDDLHLVRLKLYESVYWIANGAAFWHDGRSLKTRIAYFVSDLYCTSLAIEPTRARPN